MINCIYVYSNLCQLAHHNCRTATSAVPLVMLAFTYICNHIRVDDHIATRSKGIFRLLHGSSKLVLLHNDYGCGIVVAIHCSLQFVHKFVQTMYTKVYKHNFSHGFTAI